MQFIKAIDNILRYIETDKSASDEVKDISGFMYEMIITNQKIDLDRHKEWVLEINSRIGHYFLFDYQDQDNFVDTLNMSKEVHHTRATNLFSLFELVSKDQNGIFVTIRDLLTNQNLEVYGEFEGSEHRLMNLPIWVRMISRLITFQNKIFLLKNYYYFVWDQDEYSFVIQEYFQNNRIKLHLYEVEKIVYTLQPNEKKETESSVQINLHKRFLWTLKNILPKKKIIELKKKLENLSDPDHVFDALDFILKYLQDPRKVLFVLKEFNALIVDETSKWDQEDDSKILYVGFTLVKFMILIQLQMDKVPQSKKYEAVIEILKTWTYTQNVQEEDLHTFALAILEDDIEVEG